MEEDLELPEPPDLFNHFLQVVTCRLHVGINLPKTLRSILINFNIKIPSICKLLHVFLVLTNLNLLHPMVLEKVLNFQKFTDRQTGGQMPDKKVIRKAHLSLSSGELKIII